MSRGLLLTGQGGDFDVVLTVQVLFKNILPLKYPVLNCTLRIYCYGTGLLLLLCRYVSAIRTLSNLCYHREPTFSGILTH